MKIDADIVASYRGLLDLAALRQALEDAHEAVALDCHKLLPARDIYAITPVTLEVERETLPDGTSVYNFTIRQWPRGSVPPRER